MKIVVLSSGGLDSSLMMLLMKKDGHDIHPIHIDYGQLAEDREWESCRNACSYLEIREPIRLVASGISQIPSGLTDSSLDINRDAFLPTRNLLLVTLAAAYGHSIFCHSVAIGLIANSIFPDQTKEFVDIAQKCLATTLDVPFTLLAPLISLDKRDMLRLGEKYKFPKEIVYYCHSGTSEPCGICISCKERISAEQDILKGHDSN